MKRPGMMKLGWPMRILKIKLLGSLSEPGDFGIGETGVLPIDFESGVLRIGFDPVIPKHFSKLGQTILVSGYRFRGRFMRITIDTQGCVSRVVTMKRDRSVDIRYAQLHRRQFGIKLNLIDDESI